MTLSASLHHCVLVPADKCYHVKILYYTKSCCLSVQINSLGQWPFSYNLNIL